MEPQGLDRRELFPLLFPMTELHIQIVDFRSQLYFQKLHVKISIQICEII